MRAASRRCTTLHAIMARATMAGSPRTYWTTMGATRPLDPSKETDATSRGFPEVTRAGGDDGNGQNGRRSARRASSNPTATASTKVARRQAYASAAETLLVRAPAGAIRRSTAIQRGIAFESPPKPCRWRKCLDQLSRPRSRISSAEWVLAGDDAKQDACCERPRGEPICVVDTAARSLDKCVNGNGRRYARRRSASRRTVISRGRRQLPSITGRSALSTGQLGHGLQGPPRGHRSSAAPVLHDALHVRTM